MGRQRGRSKFEFLLGIVIFGVLASMLLARLIGIEEEAARTEIELTVRNMRVGLQLAVGERLMRGQEDRLVELLAADPAQFLGWQPPGYAQGNGNAAAPGSWRFDPAMRELAYRPRQPAAFDGRDLLKWRVAAQGVIGGRIVGIRLETLPN